MTWHYKTTPDVTLCCLEKHQVFLFCFIRTTDKLQWYERLRFTAPGTATAGVMHYAAWHFINIFQTYQRSTLEVNTLSHTPGQSAWFAAWYQHLTIKRSQNTTTDCGRHARDQSFFLTRREQMHWRNANEQQWPMVSGQEGQSVRHVFVCRLVHVRAHNLHSVARQTGTQHRAWHLTLLKTSRLLSDGW